MLAARRSIERSLRYSHEPDGDAGKDEIAVARQRVAHQPLPCRSGTRSADPDLKIAPILLAARRRRAAWACDVSTQVGFHICD